MRTILGFTAAALLLLLISGLSLLGMDPEASRYDRALADLDRLAAAESLLRQDTLNARAGLLRNYDPLNQEMHAVHDALTELRREGVDETVFRPLQNMVEQQDTLIEQFKTDNAMLRNSLAYFGLLSGRFGVAVQDGPLASAMTALATAMLHLTFDTSPASATEVADGLNRLATQGPPSKDADVVEGLLVHGRMLLDLLPATDQVLRSLYDLPKSRPLEATRVSVLAHQRASRTEARQSRLLLYAISLLLLVLLINLGLQLRRHVETLRRRAAFDQAMASISMAFVNAGTSEIGHSVEQALEKLADWIGADRAYFVQWATPPRLHLWSRNEADWPAGWPLQAPVLSARMRTDADGIVHVPSVDRLTDGPDRDDLQRAGVRGWACIPANGQDGTCTVLGFDALRAPMAWPSAELGLLRMAVDTVANAIGRALLERDRARLESSLQQARRMETIGALASGVAHNFNNIIGAIVGYTEMEELQAAPGSRLARNLAGIRQATVRARDLVEQILSFGRRRESPRRTVNLRSLMIETGSLLSASLPRGARLVLDAVPDDTIVFGDPVQLQQVIINLCNNAVQAMDGLRAVEVATDVRTVAVPQRLSHGYLPPGRYVRIAVTDTGRGMDAETLARLFEPFFTTRIEGNGLGLATVREIVRSHGGAINVTSRPGQGSLFEVWLPHAPGLPTATDGMAPVRGRGETIMVLDTDHERLLRDEEIVAALGYEPVGFTEPGQAHAACRTIPPRFDAVLISHLLPVSEALAFAAMLRSAAPDLPILLAASADELGADILADAGICEVVSRPLKSVELASALSRWLPD